MAWTTPVGVNDVRIEYPLLTADLCSDDRVTANRDRAEAEVEAILRDRYDLSDPGTDKYVWRVCMALTLYHCLNSVYGEEGWASEGRKAIGAYWREWNDFRENIQSRRIKLSLSVAKSVPLPTVGNFDLGRSAFSKFALDTHSEHGFPFPDEDD
jgi:hypothetical protein